MNHHHTTLSNPQDRFGTMSGAQSKFPMFPVHSLCISMVTLDPLKSNGQEFDLNVLGVFLGISLFFSILLSLSLKDFLRHV
jgi:hypothetical protein